MLYVKNSFSYCLKDAFIFRITSSEHIYIVCASIALGSLQFFIIIRILLIINGRNKVEIEFRKWYELLFCDELLLCCPVLAKITAGLSMNPSLFSQLFYLSFFFCPAVYVGPSQMTDQTQLIKSLEWWRGSRIDISAIQFFETIIFMKTVLYISLMQLRSLDI